MTQFTLMDSRQPDHIAHPATNAALAGLEQLKTGVNSRGYDPLNALDIGCGSGILSMLIAEKWPKCRIIASDISKLAIQEACHNIEQNGFSGQIKCICAEGLDDDEIKKQAPYDLIIANILAKWHLKYLRQMRASIKESGYIILSGIQAWQLQELEQAIPYASLQIDQRIEAQQWLALMLIPQ